MAHDLKTPLTIVRGNAELLVESNLPKEQKKYAEYIADSSLQMQKYVQTLIEVTKSWQGTGFRRQEADCNLLFYEIEQQARGLCLVNDISLSWICNYRTKQISVDHDLFIRAIINVISNAVEHTSVGGSIIISVNEEENFFVFVVQDKGKGFSEEALKHGTEQFFMDDVSRNSKSHFGIGLYVANSVIEKHNGRLLLENASENGGAKITMYLPI